jgi:hypothetical protein
MGGGPAEEMAAGKSILPMFVMALNRDALIIKGKFWHR